MRGSTREAHTHTRAR